MKIEINNDDGNLFPSPRRYRSGLTEEEILDILRFADEHDIEGVAKAQLLKHIIDVRAARRHED